MTRAFKRAKRLTMNRENRFDPPRLVIGDLVARLPIIQGGMGVGVSMASLASAVAKEGAIGVLAAVHIGITEPDFHRDPKGATQRALAKQIQEAKERSGGGIIGVNIMVALNDYRSLVETAAKAGADLIISGAGLPLKLPGMIPQGCDTKLVPIVSSPRAAQILCRRWSEHFGVLPAAIVLEGPKAGGHLGFHAEDLEKEEFSLERLLPAVIEAVRPFEKERPIPVIAAGGVYTGEDIYKFIQMGAAGVQMGTRFVATHECDVSQEFKEAYLAAGPEDVVITKSPVGMPGRALKGPFSVRDEGKDRRPKACPYKCLLTCDYKKTPYCISSALINAQRGNLKAGLVFCGENVWRVDKIVSVRELLEELVDGYRQAAEAAARS